MDGVHVICVTTILILCVLIIKVATKVRIVLEGRKYHFNIGGKCRSLKQELWCPKKKVGVKFLKFQFALIYPKIVDSINVYLKTNKQTNKQTHCSRVQIWKNLHFCFKIGVERFGEFRSETVWHTTYFSLTR